MRLWKKYHKWLGLAITIFILLFSISGIILNHRDFFSSINISRNILPQEYQYTNWNNAAVNGTIKISENNILIYGNIGVWQTDSIFMNFNDFNNGFPKGIDNKKVSKIFKTTNGNLFAGTYFGLYLYNKNISKWLKIELDIDEERIVDIAEKGDTLLVLSRSYLLKTRNYKDYTIQILPKPENYDNKAGLFKTLWLIHSGELFGIVGKIIVDIVGMIFIFLTITGLIYFTNPFIVRNRIKKKRKDIDNIIKSSKWNLIWHNKIGWLTIIFLIITTITGMFLRPPLLIPIANSKVGKIPLTILDSPNPWHDKLRRIIYDDINNKYIIATLDGIFYSDDNFDSNLKRFIKQPPTSVMGVTVFEQIAEEVLLVGSFEGLFLWNTKMSYIMDYINKKPYIQPKTRGRPIGKNVITGYSKDFKNSEFYFDFNSGAKAINSNQKFSQMSLEIKEQSMSLWNLALEVHTARIYNFIIGGFYILLIPIFGLIILFILISGFIVWYKIHR